MLPFSRRRSRTLLMSNCAYFASRTPRATFSKSQNTAMLLMSVGMVMGLWYVSAQTLTGNLDTLRHDPKTPDGVGTHPAHGLQHTPDGRRRQGGSRHPRHRKPHPCR